MHSIVIGWWYIEQKQWLVIKAAHSKQSSENLKTCQALKHLIKATILNKNANSKIDLGAHK